MFTKLSKLEKAKWNSLDQTVDKPQPLLEVTALGLKGSGKTALLHRLLGHNYSETEPTIKFRSARFRTRLLQSGKEVDVKINDTPQLINLETDSVQGLPNSWEVLCDRIDRLRRLVEQRQRLRVLNFCANSKALLLFVIDGSSQSFAQAIEFFQNLRYYYNGDHSSCSDHFVHGDPASEYDWIWGEDGRYRRLYEPGEIILVFTKADLGKPNPEAMTTCRLELEKLYPNRIKYTQITSAVTGEGILTEWEEESLTEEEHILDRQILTLFEQLFSTKRLLENLPMCYKKKKPKQEALLPIVRPLGDMPEIRSRVQKLEAQRGFFKIKKEDLNKEELAKNEFFDFHKK
jgi:hypothetical protein